MNTKQKIKNTILNSSKTSKKKPMTSIQSKSKTYGLYGFSKSSAPSKR